MIFRCPKEIVVGDSTFLRCLLRLWHSGNCKFDWNGQIVMMKTPPGDCIVSLRKENN